MALALFSIVTTLGLMSEARAETRTLTMYYTHTKEKVTATFKRNGRYDKRGLRKLNRLLRDFRRNEATKMDPELFDIVWEIYKESKSRKPITVISGYRSPKTNAMLRKRGRKVAKTSQHMKGKALDFFLPDVPVSRLRAIALRRHGGGVGYYRGSFVHVDTGSVRHWPRMSRKQLSKVFPKGRTIHLSRQGKMKRYNVAMANIKKGRRYDGSKPRYSSGGGGGLLARLFRRDADESNEVEAVKPEPKKRAPKKQPEAPAAKAVAVAKLESQSVAAGVDVLAVDAKAALAAARKARPIAPTLRVRPSAPVEAPAEVPAPVLVAEATPPATVAPVVPSFRPRANVGTQLALAPVENPAAVTAYGSAVVPTPSALRPPAPVGTENLQTASLGPPSAPAAKPAAEIDALNTRIRSALERQREARVAKADTPFVPSLSERLASIKVPTPKARTLRSDAPVLASLEPQSVAKPAGRWIVGKPGIVTKNATPDVRSTAKAVELPEAALPTARIAAAPAAPATAAPVATPARQTFVTFAGSTAKPVLKLANLRGRQIKVWATAPTTRSGAIATMRAPRFDRSTALPTPASVMAKGFTRDARRMRTDGFTGKLALGVTPQQIAMR